MAAELADVDRSGATSSPTSRTSCARRSARCRRCSRTSPTASSRPTRGRCGSALAQTERLGRLVAQLLDLSRLERGALPLEPVAFAVRPLLEQAPRVRARRHAARAAEGLRPARRPARAGDPERVHQVVANLLDNAVRHSPADGRVWLSAHATDGGRRSRSPTRGPGSRRARPSASSSASTAPTPPRARDGGSGLGLAIARWIVDAHGGAIRAEGARAARLPHGRGAAAVSARGRPLASRALAARRGDGCGAGAARARGRWPRWRSSARRRASGSRVAGAGRAALVAAADGRARPLALGCWRGAVPARALPAVRAADWVVALSPARRARLPRGRRARGRPGARSGGARRAAAPPGSARPGGRARAAGAARRGARAGSRRRARARCSPRLLLAVFVPLFAAADAAFAELVDRRCRADLALDPPVGARRRRAARARARRRAVRGAARPAAAADAGPRGAGSAASSGCSRSARSSPCSRLRRAAVSRRSSAATTTCSHRRAHLRRVRPAGLRQLIAVAALTLAVIAARAAGRGVEGARDERLLRGLLAALCVLSPRRARLRAPSGSGSTRTPSGSRGCASLADAHILWLGARASPRCSSRRAPGAAAGCRGRRRGLSARRARVRAVEPRRPDRRAQRRPLRARALDGATSRPQRGRRAAPLAAARRRAPCALERIRSTLASRGRPGAAPTSAARGPAARSRARRWRQPRREHRHAD